MTPETAKKIGSSLALKSVSIGVLIAYILMILITSGVQTTFFDGLLWILRVRSEVIGNFIAGLAAFYAFGYYFGGRASVAILIKQHNFYLVGLGWGFFTLLTTACIASFIGFALLPLLYISIFGIIPALSVGLWFGWRIKRKGELLHIKCK